MKIERKGKTYDLKLDIFFGISIGCFLGTGYGVVIGLGKTRYNFKKIPIVYPCKNPFLHSGFLAGCYCGIGFGFGFGNNLSSTIGIVKKFKIKFFDANFFFHDFDKSTERIKHF